MTPLTCRAARILLEITQQQLADRADIGIQTLIKYENGGTVTHPIWLRIKRALEQDGIRFFDEDEAEGPGVRLRNKTKGSSSKAAVRRDPVKRGPAGGSR